MPTREERSSRTPEEIRDSYYEQQREGIAALTPVPIPPAYEPPAPGTVIPGPAPYAGAFVASASIPGAWWHVTEHGCPCPATTEECRHIRAVRSFVADLDRKNRRPVAPPHPGMFQ